MPFLKCALCQFYRQIRAFARCQTSHRSWERSQKASWAREWHWGAHTHPLGAEQRRFLMLLSGVVSGISCLFQGEIGFRRFGGLITTDSISPGERASSQTEQINREHLGHQAVGFH